MTTHNNDDQPGTGSHAESWGVSSWKRFCRLVVRVFFLFLRKHQLKEYLLLKRVEIETELARLVRIARRLSHAQKQVDT